VTRVATLPPLAILAIGWTYLLVYAFPGMMTRDSYHHLREAREGVYTDGHPPVINLIWKLVDYVIAGPFGMLLLQNACFLVGLYLVMRRVFSPRRAAWVATGVYVLPPVLLPFAVIWKDPLMAGFLMLGIVALLSPRRGVRLLGLVAMFGATAVRYNAVGATLPLVVLLFEWRPGVHWLARYALALAAWLAVTLGALQLNKALTDHELHYWASLAVYDIVGTLAHVDEDLPDDELERLFAGSDLLVHEDIHATLRELYKPTDFLPITSHPTKKLWTLPITGHVGPPAHQRDAIRRAWKDTLTRWPLAYLEHRVRVMTQVVGLGVVRASGVIPKRDYIDPGTVTGLGLGTGWSELQRDLTHLYRIVVRGTPLFSVWMYVVIALLLVPVALRQRDMLAVVLSGLGLEATLLFFAPTPDYRYSHWLVICTIIALVVIAVRRRRGVTSPAEAAGGARAPRGGSPSRA
jgi:hypothetical protein